MASNQTAIAWIRRLLELPVGSGERFPEEWQTVERRVDTVHRTPVSHEIEPAGAPRLDVPDE
jgi:hypothetical protein